MKNAPQSRISLADVAQKAEGYLALGEYVESRTEAYRRVLTHEMNVAAQELRHEDHAVLHEVYHRIIMAVPI
jgi:hypothetical protein